jgi:hypothetical protein
VVFSRYTAIRVLTIWLWIVSVAAGIGGGIGIYYAARDVGGAGATALGILGGLAVATPYLALIAFITMTTETAQGVTWITSFLHDHDPAADSEEPAD